MFLHLIVHGEESAVNLKQHGGQTKEFDACNVLQLISKSHALRHCRSMPGFQWTHDGKERTRIEETRIEAPAYLHQLRLHHLAHVGFAEANLERNLLTSST